MSDVKVVGIKALKDNLSSYLRDVKAGTLVLVTDRGRVVAELREPDLDRLASKDASLLNEWIREGRLVPAINIKKRCVPSGIHLETGTAIRLLDEERGK